MIIGKASTISYVEHAPDIVFLDIHLPDMDGRELLKQIREFDGDAYVVMLSGDSLPRNVIETKKAGAAGFITKPFNKEKVMHYISHCPTITRKNVA